MSCGTIDLGMPHWKNTSWFVVNDEINEFTCACLTCPMEKLNKLSYTSSEGMETMETEPFSLIHWTFRGLIGWTQETTI